MNVRNAYVRIHMEIWRTADGRLIPYTDLTIDHIENIIVWCDKQINLAENMCDEELMQIYTCTPDIWRSPQIARNDVYAYFGHLSIVCNSLLQKRRGQ